MTAGGRRSTLISFLDGPLHRKKVTLTYLELEAIPAWHARAYVALTALAVSAEVGFNSAVRPSLILCNAVILHSYLSSSATSVFTGFVYVLPVLTSIYSSASPLYTRLYKRRLCDASDYQNMLHLVKHDGVDACDEAASVGSV